MTPKPRLRIKGTELRRLRLEALLSQAELAQKSKVKEHTIKALELNRYKGAHPRHVRALAKALKVEPSAFSEVKPDLEPEEQAS